MKNKTTFKADQTQMTLFDDGGNTLFEEEVVEGLDFFESFEEIAPQNPYLEVGTTFVRKYVIENFLGQGALGIAYVAEEEGSRNRVVIKEFFPKGMVKRELDSTVALEENATTHQQKSYEKMKKVFEEEAQNIVTINTVPHKNVAGFVSLERDVNNTVYYLMPYSEGEELGDYLERLKAKGHKLSQKEIMALVEPILNGLSHIHGYGVYHKDIKPANIYIRKDDEPLLIDFGASVTSAHLMTPSYAPIEQVKRIASEYGAYTDIYAVGVIMYEMIVGSKPPKSQARAEAMGRGERDPYHPLSKNAEIKGFEKYFLVSIDHALELAYTNRPQTAQLFKEELRGDLKRKKRNRWLLLTILGLMLFSLLGYAVYENQREKYGYLIVSNSANAQVLVDNRRVEADKENRYPILLGEHSLEIDNGMGYLSQIQELEFKAENEQHRIENVLVKKQLLIEVRNFNNMITQVEINGAFVGNTPYIGKLFYDKAHGGLDKKYKIILKKEGYDNSVEKSFDYKELMQNKSSKFNFKLRKQEGFVEIKSPVGFKVKVNGRLLKNSDGRIELTPITFKKIPGKYSIYLYSSKRELVGKNQIKVYKPILKKVEVKDKETTLFPQIEAKKNSKYLLAKKREKEKTIEKKNKVTTKELLKIAKQPNMSLAFNGVQFAKTEVTYDELVRFLNASSLSEKMLGRYFNTRANSVARYIKKELVNGVMEYHVYRGYENYPVIQISWHGAKAYVAWLNEATNSSYRLPTQSEWRAVAMEVDAENLNTVLAPVGSLEANSFGLFDIYGNVTEWSEDSFGDYSRVTLGGSFNTLKNYLMPTMQNSMNAHNNKNSDIGFRLVR